MLREKFKTWLADSIFDTTLFVLDMHVINLDYLEDGAPCITELPNSNMEELNLGLGLNYAAAISDNDNQPLLDLSDLKVEQVKKKTKKTQRYQEENYFGIGNFFC